MISRYLAACIGLFQAPQVGILGEHEEPRRFRGTKVYVRSDSISPDYPIDATIHHTERGGLDVCVTWSDLYGRIHGPYLLKPEDKIEIISVRDAKSLAVRPTPEPVVKQIQEARTRPNKSSTEKLVSFLRKNDIGCKVTGDRISVIMGMYYIDSVDDQFELGSVKRGVVASFPQSKEGASRLLKKILKIENSINYEKMLEKVGE